MITICAASMGIYGDYTKLPDLDAIHPHVNHIEIYD